MSSDLVKKQDRIISVVKPLVAGASVLGLNYYLGKGNSANSIQLHLPSAGIMAASVVASELVVGKVPISDDEGIKSIESIVLQPALSGAFYAGGRYFMHGNKNFVYNGAVGAGANVASTYLTSPIERFFM